MASWIITQVLWLNRFLRSRSCFQKVYIRKIITKPRFIRRTSCVMLEHVLAPLVPLKGDLSVQRHPAPDTAATVCECDGQVSTKYTSNSLLDCCIFFIQNRAETRANVNTLLAVTQVAKWCKPNVCFRWLYWQHCTNLGKGALFITTLPTMGQHLQSWFKSEKVEGVISLVTHHWSKIQKDIGLTLSASNIGQIECHALAQPLEFAPWAASVQNSFYRDFKQCFFFCCC